MRGLIALIVIVWLVIGAFAAYQRGYFGSNHDVSCKKASDTALTVVAGPLELLRGEPEDHLRDAPALEVASHLAGRGGSCASSTRSAIESTTRVGR